MGELKTKVFNFSWILVGDEIVLGFVHTPRMILVYPKTEEKEEQIIIKQMLTFGFLFFRIDLILN